MTFAKYCKNRLTRSANRLVSLLKQNAPDVILANEIYLLWQYAEGAVGEDLYRRLLEGRTKVVRQYSAYCSEVGCENLVGKALSYPPTCEHCEAKLEAELES